VWRSLSTCDWYPQPRTQGSWRTSTTWKGGATMNPPAEKPTFIESIHDEVTQTSTFYANVGQEFVTTTTDRLLLCLHRHSDRLAASHGWVAPVSIFFTSLAALVTSSFQKVVFSAETWQAVFLVLCLISAIWSVRAIFKTWYSDTSLETIVAEIKQYQGNSEILPARTVPSTSARTDSSRVVLPQSLAGPPRD